MIYRKRSYLLLTLILCIFSVTLLVNAQAYSAPLNITYPVSGQTIFYGNGTIYVGDTQTGIVTAIESNVDLPRQPNWFWNDAKYSYFADTSFHIRSIDQTFSLDSMNLGTVVGRIDKASNVSSIPIYIFDMFVTNTQSLSLWDQSTNTIMHLDQYHIEAIVDSSASIPLPMGTTRYRLQEIRIIQQNPIHSDWILIQSYGTNPDEIYDNPDDPSGPQEEPLSINYIWNYVTNEVVSLDDRINGDILADEIEWHPDGDKIAFGTHLRGNNSFYLGVADFYQDGSGWQVTIDKITEEREYNFSSWLGVDDIFLTFNTESAFLTQIIVV